MPLIDQPFQQMAMDVVGPLPRTRSGNKYILTICDYATRYPEAIALPNTEASRIAVGGQLGRTTITNHTVNVGDASPIRQHPYRVPLAMRDKVKGEIDKMLKLGAIQSSSSPWASPVVLVEKKNGDVFFCVDYRKVNQVAKFDAYPMPRVEDVLEGVGSAKYITTLDLARGYWQVPMAEEAKEITAFTTPFGLYEFTFGLHTAPVTFQRMMTEVLKECQEFAQSYIDDVVVYSKTWDRHLREL